MLLAADAASHKDQPNRWNPSALNPYRENERLKEHWANVQQKIIAFLNKHQHEIHFKLRLGDALGV